jgi:salicylate hydroxylase
MTDTRRRIAIIGGGIGGLTAALALLRRGMTAHVFEQSVKSKEAGAGIEISPNGVRVLDALGLEDALGRAGVVLSGRELRHWKTGETWRWPAPGATVVRHPGAHHMMMHRRDLHAILLDAVRELDPDAIQLGRRCIGLAQSDEQVEVQFDTGETFHTAYAIGADGIHSRVRECLLGIDRAGFTGCVAWRGLAAAERLPSAFLSRNIGTNWLGPNGHVFHYPIRRGELTNFVGIVE